MSRKTAPPSPATEITQREALLQEATQLVMGSRNVAYGRPEDNFKNIAENWNAYLTQKARAGIFDPSAPIRAQDVAHMLILMKMARLATNPGHRDSLVDIAGYAACGADCL